MYQCQAPQFQLRRPTVERRTTQKWVVYEIWRTSIVITLRNPSSPVGIVQQWLQEWLIENDGQLSQIVKLFAKPSAELSQKTCFGIIGGMRPSPTKQSKTTARTQEMDLRREPGGFDISTRSYQRLEGPSYREYRVLFWVQGDDTV